MQMVIYNHLSTMLDELLEKAIKEKPKNINIDKKYNRNTFEWENLIIIDEKTIYPIIKIIINDLVDDYNNTIFYPTLYTNYQKELINKIFEKWGNNKYIYTRL